ncbi:unnamed protein product [Chondrus crispus]|uniref:Uncharacterized protein n=1 Tax=Chondrus crispus TaxID=2769 RepID=R7QJ97_CHOCR|nr:unnamed protein product [Chondrus crispus]CDF38174.1 unnamed protein product [Chondrus crispus]|eukprot:XP_005718043.1 unnamed protein product [Chondrus crispus]
MAAQVTAESYSFESNRSLNSIVRHIKKTGEMRLTFLKLDHDTLRLVVYANSSFNNREESRSQLGFIIVLADKSEKCAVLHYASYKSRRVARSSMGGEKLAFVDAFDCSFLLRHDISRMLGRHIPLIMLTDSKILFDVLTRSRYTSERRLMVDISASRQAYREGSISDVALIPSEDNVADAFTKVCSNGALNRLLRSGKLQHRVTQWVIRSKSPLAPCRPLTSKTGQ